MFEELENSKVKWSSKDEEEVQSAEQEGTSSTGTSIFEIESNSEVLMSYKGMYNRLALTLCPEISKLHISLTKSFFKDPSFSKKHLEELNVAEYHPNFFLDLKQTCILNLHPVSFYSRL